MVKSTMAAPCFVPGPPACARRERPGAFTLVEMLVVISIAAVLLALIAPAVTGIGFAGNFNGAAYSIADTLEKARAYAMANNTYVWVGFIEQNNSGGVPSVNVAIVASKDGTCAYDPDQPAALNPAQLRPLDRTLRFANLHLGSTQESTRFDQNHAPATGMSRPAVTDPADELGEGGMAGNLSATPFTAPLDGSPQKFSKVIEYNPQGVTRIVPVGAVSRSVPDVIEILLLPVHGPAVQYNGNAAAIQISGLTGALQLYRP